MTPAPSGVPGAVDRARRPRSGDPTSGPGRDGAAGDKLTEYRRRRHASVTPEPVPAADPGLAGGDPRHAGGGGPAAPRVFVVQEHHASALHWDFRLERDGVLVSWAVPKGLPRDGRTNHLAVHTEDHPLQYATFEGTIPEGAYGGGRVVLWDHGTYDELKWSDHEVMVDLHGERVQGRYVLFSTRGRDTGRGAGRARDWLVHRMDQPAEGYEPLPRHLRPMLATTGPLPKDDDAWAFELKWDGVRAIAVVDGGRIHLTSRNGNDLTSAFPELRAMGEQLGSRQVVLDGEIVAFDEAGRPSFQLLQPRIHASEGRRAGRAGSAPAVVYVLFDLLYVDGESLLGRPYGERRGRLEALGLEQAPDGRWALSPRFGGPGSEVLRASLDQGLEGVVAKRLDSPYLPGKRSRTWTKVKNFRTQEVVIGGWTPGEGHRRGWIGSLLLGIASPDGLVYVGQVGTGFTGESLAELGQRLEPLRSAASPFATEVPPRYRNVATWVEPRLVGEVRFGEWTKEGRMRHPSWRGLRTDKGPDEVRREP